MLGVIGPTASGKSTVLEALGHLGAATVRADDASRALLQPGSPALARVIEMFGADFANADGSLNRGRLGDLVFGDADARGRLEAYLHPLMVAWLRERIAEFGNTERPPVVVGFEAAILDRMGARTLCDRVLLVTAPRPVRLARLVAKGLSPEQACARIAAQDGMGLEACADYVIDTAGPMAQTRAKVAAFWLRMTRDATD